MIVTHLSPPFAGEPTHTNSEWSWQQEAQKSANLARIRENQRRSRLRRKEYVQELEAKNREYEQQQVKASIEMQAAAKSVAEENKTLKSKLQEAKDANAQLREFISSMGVSEIDLEQRLAHSRLSSRSNSSSQILPSPTGAAGPSFSNVSEHLNSLLLPNSPENKSSQLSYMSSASRKPP